MPDAFQSADFYKDQIVSTKRIGNQFSDCCFDWGFPADLLEPKNDSIETDIEYSFDGTHVAGRLRHGTDAELGGESYTYRDTERMKIYFRRAHDADDNVEYEGEEDIPYRLWVDRETGADRR